MELGNAELNKMSDQRKDPGKRRFQIVKLEERVAPTHKMCRCVRYSGRSGACFKYVGHCDPFTV